MFSKIIKTFGVKLITALLNLFIAVLVSQYLGPAGKGEQGIIITSITFILIFSNIVGGASIVYLAPRLHVKKIIAISYLWTIITGGLFAFILYWFDLVESRFTLHIVLLACINSLLSVNYSVLLGKENIKSVNILTFLQVLVTVVVLTILFACNLLVNINAYFLSLYISYSSVLILSLFYLQPLFKAVRQEENSFWYATKMLFRYGFINQLAHITQLLSFRISYYFLETYSGYKAVGIYSNAVSVIESLWMISGSIAVVQYSKISNSNDKKSNQNLTIELLKIGTLVTLILIIPVILLPSGFFSVIFGREFFDMNRVMLLLAPGILIYVFALITGHYFSGSGKYHINTIGSAIGFLATIILSLTLIPAFGYLGAAVTASISYFSTSLFLVIIFCHESRVSPLALVAKPKDISGYYQKTLQYFRKSKYE